jgi:NTE family protein
VAAVAPEHPVALVLAGGGARGAYEVGALSVLLPELEARGERPSIILGTSAGALNAAYLAANAQLAVADLLPTALQIWESISWGMVVRPLISGASLRRVGAYLGEAVGVPGVRLVSLLDPAPLRRTVAQRVDFDQLARNVAAGAVSAAGVVTTSARTGRSVVFHAGGGSPPRDRRRAIDYVTASIAEDHVLASAAIPVIFPAVEVQRPAPARGWYIDGGTRMNTPIKPALAFGAGRVVVIALNSLAPGPARPAGSARPDALLGAGQVLLGLLEDQLVSDLQTLAGVNDLVTASGATELAGKRQVPYIVIAPRTRTTIGEIALRVIRECCSGPVNAVRSPDLAFLARLLAADTDPQHAELLSFLLFEAQFGEALIELGRRDARRWLAASHDLDDLWQLGPLNPD